jgi:epoxyqueuosine reductase
MPAHFPRPPIETVPMSNDVQKIEFFGMLMPALLLLKAAPLRFLGHQLAGKITPRDSIEHFIASQCDDAASLGDTLVFVHRWESLTFDPFTFAKAKTFLNKLTRLLHKNGFHAGPVTPLSPRLNLPRLGAAAGLGNLSPYGLLVHPIFGPRLILTGMKTDYPLELRPRWGGDGCEDCLACVKLCPQKPIQTGKVHLRECQTCAKCLLVCPTGKGRHERAILKAL